MKSGNSLSLASPFSGSHTLSIIQADVVSAVYQGTTNSLFVDPVIKKTVRLPEWHVINEILDNKDVIAGKIK